LIGTLGPEDEYTKKAIDTKAVCSSRCSTNPAAPPIWQPERKKWLETMSPQANNENDKLLFAANATPESLLLSSSNASLCVWYGRLPDIHARKIKTPDANTSNRKRLIEPQD
jgi:hypothetical protein